MQRYYNLTNYLIWYNNLNDEDNSNIYNSHYYGYQSSNECSNDIKVLFSL